MKLLLCLACLGLVWAGANASCEEGPTYWCRDVATASKCGRIKYCHENDWKSKVGAEVSCDVCTFVATVVDALLKQNKTQEEAQAFVGKLCNSLGSLSTECDTLVSKDFYVIWDFVVEEVDPSVICYKLGYCPGSKVTSKTPAGSVECDLCTFVAQYLEKLMHSNITEAEAETEVEKLCTYLGSLAPECESFIQTNFDSLWTLLENDLQTDFICVKLNVCQASLPIAKEASAPTDSNCETCILIATYIDALMAKNVTKLEGESLALSLCGYLGVVGPECDQFVEMHFDSVWALLEEDLKPNVICVKLNICTSYVAPSKTALSAQSSVHQPEGIFGCEECKVLIDLVHDEVEKSSTQAEAMMVALKVCSELGGLNFLCSIIINDTFATIWATVVNDLSDSTKVCVFLEKCSSEEMSQKSVLGTALTMSPPTTGDPTCELCEALINFVVDLGEKDNTTIEKFAYAFCSSLSDPTMASLCENIINTTFVDAWNLVIHSVNGTKLCQELGKCPLSTKKTSPILTGVSDNAECQLCYAVINYVEYKASLNSTEVFAQAVAGIVCGYLGGLSGLCNEVINKSFDQIWKRFVSDLSLATMLCQIEFCSQVKAPAPRVPHILPKQQTVVAKRSASTSVQYTECDVCKLVAYVLDSVAMNNATEQEAKIEAENLCSLLGEYSTLCSQFVGTNFQAIWTLVIKDLEPNVICVYLKFCTGSKSAHEASVEGSKSLPTVTTCEICKGIAFLMDSLVKNNVSQADAKMLIDDECAKLGMYAQMCVILVNDYFDDIWTLLINDLEPDFICAKIGVCSNTTCTAVHREQSIECTACEEMLVGMEGVIDENTTEGEAYTLMEMFCNVLPPEIMSKCKDLVQADFFLAWDMFKECVDNPKQCCSKIGVCNTTLSGDTNLFEKLLSKKAKGGSNPQEGSDFSCILCEYIMKELDSILAENATEAEVEAALDKVCSLIPKSLVSYCDSMVAEYAPQIIKLLLEDTEPRMVCTHLKLCTSQSKSATTHTGTSHLY